MCVQWSGSLCLDFSSGDCVKSHTLAINVKQLQWSSGEMSTGLVGITPAIGLSAYWLAGCHWRPGCQGNRTSVTSCSCSPPRPSPLSAAPSRSYSGPYLLPFKGQGLRKLPHACIYVRMYMCLWVRMMCVCVCVCVCVCNSNSVSVSRRVATVSPGDGLWCQSVAAAHNKSVITELEKPERERVVLNSPFLFHIVVLFHIVFYFLQSSFPFPPSVFPPFFPIHHFHSFLFNALLPLVHFFPLHSINPFGPSCFCPFPLLCLYIHRVLPYFAASCFHFLNLTLLSTFPYTPIPSPSATFYSSFLAYLPFTPP